MSERTHTTSEPGFLRRALTKRLVERLASGRLPPFLTGWVYRRLDEDEEMARHYDALRQMERAAAGHPPLSGAQRDLVRARLFGGALPLAEKEAAPPARVWPRVVVPLLGAAAATVLFVQIEGSPVDGGGDGWTARGLPAAAVGVRARCLSSSGTAVVSQAEAGIGATVAAPELSCSRDGLLALSATNRTDHEVYVFIVGVAPDGDARWYAPFSRDERSLPVQAGGVDVVLGDLAALRALPDDGRVALHALFSPKPLSAEKVEAALERARRGGLDPSRLARLPVNATVQARVDLVMIDDAEAH